MRYEDTSGSLSSSTAPEARDDADSLADGSNGPATGNVITGAGTTTGKAGADTPGDAHVVAVRGAGGTDTSDGGPSLNVDGRYGSLVMDEHGNYKYVADGHAPQNFRDLFQYTLADSKGQSVADLVITRGGEIKVSENAQQIVPGPDGVVTLPPGVDLSDVHVVGRNLVVNLPDGQQIVIVDGAVFVPQLVLGGVEVPSTNLAALLIDTEPKPAAGTPQSSGGNFADPVPPLDPGVPLGDLIPPTELVFTPPEFEEIGQFIDEEPEAGIATALLDDDNMAGGNPLSNVGDDPGTDPASGQLPGSGGDGSLEWALTTGGTLPTGFSYALQGNGDVWVLQGADHVLTISVDPATGEYTVDQLAALDHPAGGDENNLIFTINYTVTDEDGDTAVGTLTIDVDDDTPSVTVSAGSDANVILTTDDAQTIGAASDTDVTSANFSGVFSGTAIAFGADGAGPGTSSSYALAVTAQNSGLTSHGATINLFVVNGVVVGTTAASAGGIDASNTVFTVSTTNTGVVTLTQFQQIDHPAENPSGAPFNDQIISLSDGLVTLTRSETVVDGDGDSVTGSASVNIGANLHFTDDGPTIALADRGEPTLSVDESNFAVDDSQSFAANFAATFGADGPGGVTYSLGVSGTNANSGLIDSLTGQAVVLNVVNGQVVGTAGIGGPVVFTISVDSSGNVTLDESRAVMHTPDTGVDQATTMSADNLVTLTATATDFDGDTASQALDIGLDFVFRDDAPTVNPAVHAAATVTVDETLPSDAATINTGAIDKGDDPDLSGGLAIGKANSGVAIVDANAAFGADGPATSGSLTYALDVVTANSGVTLTDGSTITLQEVNGVIVGVVDNGTFAGKAAFAISIDSSSGVVSVEQYLSLDHPLNPDPNDPLQLGDNTVGVTVTATDRDGDQVTSGAVDISGQITFLDDGPSANDDSDTVDNATDTATGNVITGAATIEGTGNADVPGADGFGSITGVVSDRNAHSDTNPSGGFTVVGDYGTLQMDASGTYTYTRDPSSPGAISESFTYTYVDGDGDPASATLTIGINDSVPSLPNPPQANLDDDVIPGLNGNLDGVGDDDPDVVGQNVVNGTLIGSGGDGGNLDYFFSATQSGLPSGFSVGAGSDVDTLIIVQDQGGNPVTVLTIQLNNDTGAYTVTQNAAIWHPAGNNENNIPNINVSFFAQDVDGSQSPPATLTINVDDDTPTINVTAGADAAVVLTTDDVQTIAGASDSDVSTANFSGVFGLTSSAGADGTNTPATLAYALNVSSQGVDSGLNQTGNNIYLYKDAGGNIVGSTSNTFAGVTAGNTVFSVSVSNTGVVTLTQFSQIDHPVEGTTTAPFNDQFVSLVDSLVTLTASSTITDRDGDTATDQETVNIGANLHFTDDGPDVAAALTGTQIRIDETDNVVAIGGETDSPGGNLGTVTMTLASLVNVTIPHTSADTPQTNSYSLVLSSQGVDSGLDVSSNNASIFLYDMGGGVIAGSTSATLVGVNAGNTAFTISIDSGSGAVTMTQFLAIEHSNTGSNDEDSSGLAAGALNLVVTGTDFDGDTDSASVDLGSIVRFEDDGPTLGTIQNGTANNNPAAAHSFGSLHFATGSDTPADVTSITTGSLAGITSGGKALVTNFNNTTNVLTAYQDANSNGTYDAATDTTVVFTLTVNPTGGPNGGTWDFDLVTALDPTVTEVDIGGSSSFGAGPTLGQVLTDGAPGTPAPLSVVSGYHPTGSFSISTWMSTGALPTSAVTSTGVNGSTAGWGVDNNNFETGSNGQEIMFFDFGNQALANPDGDPPPAGPDPADYTPPAVTLPDISFAKFDFIGYKSGAGNGGDDIAYVVHFTDGSFASGWVPDANIDGATWQFSAPAGKFIADISFYSGVEPDGSTVQNLPPGKIDLVSVGVTTSSLDKDIGFNVTLTDADGDPVSGSFTVNVDTTNTPSVASPVVLDLNGDGAHFLSLAAGVHYDYGSGSVATAWASPQDGILVHDANGNHTVDNASEFVFGSGSISDLQGLASYDTNHDGQLSSADAGFASFGVWQDANSNGQVDSGEYQTLTAHGITLISLTSDGIHYTAANDDVDVVGTGSYTTADGASHALADAAFHLGARATEEARTATASSGGTGILAAALAAAGLAASEPLAAANLHIGSVGTTTSSSIAGVHNEALAPIQLDSFSGTHSSALLTNLTNMHGMVTANATSLHSTYDAQPHMLLDSAAATHDMSSMSALLSGTSMMVHDAVLSQSPMIASAVMMPSAEQMFATMNANGVATQQNQVVGQVLADALNGGGVHGGSLDALINSLPSHSGDAGNAVLADVSSQAAFGVPFGDTGVFGSFTPAHAMFTMEHMMAHQDAAPNA